NGGDGRLAYTAVFERGVASIYSVTPAAGELAPGEEVALHVSTSAIPAVASTEEDGFADVLRLTDGRTGGQHRIPVDQTARRWASLARGADAGVRVTSRPGKTTAARSWMTAGWHAGGETTVAPWALVIRAQRSPDHAWCRGCGRSLGCTQVLVPRAPLAPP